MEQLFLAVTGNLIMTLGRLFETRQDYRVASLTTFLDHVQKLGIENPSHLKKRESAYLEAIPRFRKSIRWIEARLRWYRDAYVAHNDLTKVGKVNIKWVQIKGFISVAQRILKGYYHAHHETDQRFGVVNLEHEPEQFLVWCRLDDYEKHWKVHIQARRADLQRRAQGLMSLAGEPPTDGPYLFPDTVDPRGPKGK